MPHGLSSTFLPAKHEACFNLRTTHQSSLITHHSQLGRVRITSLLALCALLLALCVLPFVARTRAAADLSPITDHSSLGWISDRAWLHPSSVGSSPFAFSSLLFTPLSTPEPFFFANTANNYSGSGTGNITTGSNWSLTHFPTVSEDATFASTSNSGIKNFGTGATVGGPVTVGSCNVTAITGTYSIRNATTSATNATLNLGGSGDLGNSVSGTASDLLYVASGATFQLLGDNPNGSGVMSVVLGQSGDFDAVGTMNISAVVLGTGFGITKTGGGNLTLSGANTYTVNTTISAGKLLLSTTGSIANSPNIIIAGGGTLDISTRGGVTFTAGQSLQGSGTSTTGTIATAASNGLTTASNSPLKFTAFNGTTAPLTISGVGTITLVGTNPVTVNTTSALGAGDYTLIAKGASGTVAGSVPTSLTIGGSGLASGMGAVLQITSSQLVLHVAAAGSLQFSSATYSDNETNANHSFNYLVTRAGGSTGAVTIDYQVTDGSATVSGNDYSVASPTGTLSWSDGDTAVKNLTITVKGDITIEPNETVNAQVSNPTGGATLGTPNSAVLTITNDDFGNTISGTLFDAGGSPITDGRTIKLIQNGTVSATTATTNGSGVYTFTGLTLANTDQISVFIDNASEKGTTCTVIGSSPADISNFDVTASALRIRTDDGASTITNSNLSQLDNTHDADIPFTYSSGSITTTDGTALQIDLTSSYTPGGAVNVGGHWTNNSGNFVNGGKTVTLNGTGAQTITTGGISAGHSFAGFTINKASGTATLAGNLSDTALNITQGTFDQGASFNVSSGALTVGANGTWTNLGTGDLTLSGDVSNAGTINFNANGTPCGDTPNNDDILIRSSDSGNPTPTRRTWSGTGTFSMTDVDVKDQKMPGGLTPPIFILVNSGADSGNNTGWQFVNQCTSGTYTWIGGTLGAATDWTVGTNWNPTRVSPSASDVLIFDGNSTPSPTVTNVPMQEIAVLRLQNNSVAVTLSASGTNTLTISGATGNDLSIPSGTSLTVSGTNALTIALSAGSAANVDNSTSGIRGSVSLLQGAHRLTGASASSIVFKTNSSSFSAGSVVTTGFTGNPFGTGTNGSVVFDAGSNGFFNEGGDPFGGDGHKVAVFNFNSTAWFNAASALSCSNPASSEGRSYGNLVLDNQAGGSATYTCAGALPLTVLNNLSINSSRTFTLSSSAGGDLILDGNFSDDGTFAPNSRTVNFNGGATLQTITKSSGTESFFDVFISETTGGKIQLLSPLAINGQLNFNTAASVLELNGKTLTLNGTITGSGNLKGDSAATLSIGGMGALGTLNFASGGQLLSALALDRSSSGSATLGTSLAIGGSLTLTNGILDAGTNTLSLGSAATTSRTSGYVVGNLQKTFGATGTFTFPVGTGTGGAYSPVDANVTAGTGNSLTIKAVAGQEPHVSGNALQRYWTLTNSGSVTANLTFHYLAADVVGSESIYKIFKYDTSLHQFSPDVLNTSGHFATLNNVSSFSNWTLAEGCADPPSGMTSWWPGDGKAIDVQGVYNGIQRNGATFATGKVGQAFSFDGVDDYVKLPDNFFPYPTSGTGTTAFTFDAWFKTATAGVIIGQQNSDPFTNAGSFVPGLYVGTDGKLRAEMFWNGSVTPITSAATVNDNVFHHVAVTYDGTTEILYLDGANVGSSAHTQVSYGSFYKYQLGTGLTGGGWPSGNGTWLNFNGLIDEVELFNRALTSTEVQALFNQDSLGKCKPADSDGDGVPDIHDACPGTAPNVVVTADGCDASACVTPPANLIGWWAADGNAKDLQGAHDGTLVNGTTFNAGEVGPAFVFDGVDDRVTTTLDVQPSAMPTTTWDAWVYPTINNGTRQTIMTSDDGGFDREVSLENIGSFGVFTGSGLWTPISFDLNQWQHIAVVYTPTNILFYKNGVEYSFGAAPTTGTTTNKFAIGENLGGGGIQPFQGRIDEVEVFNAQVSATDIQRNYNIGGVGKCKGTQPPNVGYIIRADANPSPASSVHFTVVFTNSVTGVDASDFVVTTTGSLSDAVVTNITGSGTTYTVTVGNYIGSGTLRLDVVDDDSINDGSLPLGGSGLGNGNFTAGEIYTINGADITTPFVVTKTADTNDGHCDSDCSLREAILAANADPGPDTINFNILNSDPGCDGTTHVCTIIPNSTGNGGLPSITSSTMVNGYSQPGSSVNNQATSDNAVILIELRGTSVGPNTAGLTLTGGSSTVKGLVINRFSRYGIDVTGNGTSGNLIVGNFIGVNPDGTGAIGTTGNGGDAGVESEVNGGSTTVGGTAPADRNVISGNSGNGVEFFFSGTATVLGNFIGLAADGTTGIGNGASGIGTNFGGPNTLGGTAAGARNYIGSNHGAGIFLSHGTGTIQGNYIGTDASGTLDRGNLGDGIGTNVVGGFTIGGSTAGAGNLISANHGNGISLSDPGFIVQGNLIGTKADGTSALGNLQHGIAVANTETIGGVNAGEGNTIAFNGHDGVNASGTRNIIRSNSIFSNGTAAADLGIDLGPDGVTPNDTGDGDTGANNLQNFPIITSAQAGVTNTIAGTLNSNASRTYTIDFYSNTTCDTSGQGEGKTYLGSTNVMTDGSGNIGFTFHPASLSTGDIVTATATDTSLFDDDNNVNTAMVPHNDTSEFSQCVGVAALPADLSITKTDSQDPVTEGNNLTYTITVTDNGPNNATNVTVTDTLPANVTFVSATPAQGSCSGTSTITCNLGTINNAANATVLINVTPTSAAANTTLSNTATVTAAEPDPSTPNSATQTTQVAAASCTSAPAGLVAWYPGDGNADDVKNGNKGTLQNGAMFAPGKVDQAFSLNGTNEFVEVSDAPANSPTTALSIDAWIKPNNTSTDQSIVSKYDACSGQQRSYELDLVSGGAVQFAVYNGQPDPNGYRAVRTGSGAITAGVFTHVAGTFDTNGQVMKIYVNGVDTSAPSLAGSVNVNSIFDSNTPVDIGRTFCTTGGPGNYFNGLIDETEIFNAALSSTDIANIYNASFAGKCRTCTTAPSGMVSWWDGSGSGTTANDINGPSPGTLQNGATFTVGKDGQAFSFDGIDDQVLVPHDAAQNTGAQITLDAWIRPTAFAALNSNPSIINKRTAGNAEGYTLESNNAGNGLYFEITTSDGVFAVTAPKALTLNTWQHVAATYDGTTLRIFVNGVQVSYNGGSGTINAVNSDLVIGRNIALGSSFTGQIDEVELFNTALSQSQIAAIADAGNAGKCHTSTIQFSSATYLVGEGDGTATITVTRTGAHDTTASVHYATQSGGTAAGGASCTTGIDYQNIPDTTLQFDPGDVSKIFTVPICDDNIDEPDETVSLELFNVSGATLGTPADPVFLTITDNDNAPTVSIGDVTQAEGNSGPATFAFTVSLSDPSASDVVVDYSTMDGTANAGGDFAGVTNGQLTIPAGSTSGTINITVNGDTAYEANETFTVHINSATNTSSITDADGLGTITNDDSAPAFSIDDVTHQEGDASTTSFVFTVTKTGATEVNSQVDFTTQDGSATLADNDYTLNTGTLYFLPNDTTKTITVLVNGDTTVEPDEAFNVHLSNESGAAIADANGTGTITNDDFPLGAALDFDGVDDYVSVPNNAALHPTTAITMEAWVKPMGGGNYARIADNESVQLLAVNLNKRFKWQVATANGANSVGDISDFVNGTWYHVAGTYDGSTVRLYVNGVLVGSTPLTGAITASTQALLLGFGYDPYFLQGQMDEFRLWNRALCQDEIQAHMNCELIANETGLIAYYKFNQGSAGGSNPSVNTLTDSSPNGFTGTLNNFALSGTTSSWVAPGGVNTGTTCAVFLAPEIDAQGNGNPVPDGLTSPNAGNGTEFGSVAIGSSLDHTFVISNTGSADLHISGITAGGDFSIFSPSSFPVAVTPSDSVNLVARFTPSASGLRTATVHIANDDCDEADYDFAVQGTGATDTDVSLSGGSLVITDSNGGNTDDTLTLSLNGGSNVRVNDPNHTLSCGGGITQVDANTCEVPLASISGNIQVSTLAGNDTLTLNFANGNFMPASGLSYAGGDPTTGPGDKLIITGGSQGTVSYNYTNAHDGNIVMSSFGTVSFTGLEPITNGGDSTDTVFNLPAGPNAVTLGDDGTTGNTLSSLSAATIETTNFANPSNSLKINRGDATDTIALNALPDFNASLTIGTSLNPFGTIVFNGTVAVTGTAAVNVTAGDVNGSGNISTAGGVFVTNTGTSSTLSGVIGGAGTLSKQGAAILVLSGANTYTGATSINAGRLNLNGSITSNTTVNSGGTLGGTGTINSANIVTVNSGGTVAPGSSPGILNTGSLTFNSSSTFKVEIGGITPGSGAGNHDQLNVTGTVSLGNATLSLSSFGGFTPSAGQTFTIVTNDGADAINGNFNGLMEGAVIPNFLGSGLNATITYQGGTNNNDVILTAAAPAPEISVEQPAGTDLTSGSSTPIDFGSSDVGVPSATSPKTFTIKNAGPGDLTISGITSDTSEFVVDTTGMSTTVTANNSTTFKVTFTPGAPGIRNGAIHIGNNDSDENPFDINLTGTGNCPTGFVVNSTADTDDANEGDGICADAGGKCTLRAAIEEANAIRSDCSGLTISFNIPANDPAHVYYKDDGLAGHVTNDIAHIGFTTLGDDSSILDVDPDYNHSWWRIRPDNSLPDINVGMIIDGYSQGANTLQTASPNALDLNHGDDAVLRIEIDGSQIVNGTGDGFELFANDGSTFKGLVINHFENNDIYIEDGGGDIFSGNFIGVDVSGTLVDGTNSEGIFIDTGDGVIIGSEDPADRNLISGRGGEGGAGISINTDFTTVEGNYIGTDRTGAVKLPNTFGIIVDGGNDNTIGCEVLNGDNLISGNKDSGVRITSSFGTWVQGNLIGTDKTGLLPLPNEDGVTVFGGASNSIGRIGFGNVISGNTGEGVELNNGTSSNLVQSNLIGVAADGTSQLPNGANGVEVYTSSSDNTIGVSPRVRQTTTAQLSVKKTDSRSRGISLADNLTGANVIAFNGEDGVRVTGVGDLRNRISQNSIYSNTGLGINLGTDGVTDNDPGDGDTGPNNLQNFPALLTVSSSGGSGTVHFSLDVDDSAGPFTIEFFSNTACDPTVHGEGKTYLGSTEVPGSGTYDSGSLTINPGDVITATATDASGNTSEFSVCKATAATCPSVFTVADDSDVGDATPGDGVCETVNNTCTLRAAIEEANALTTCDTIDIDLATSGPMLIMLGGTQLTVDHNVNINGPTTDSVTVNGNAQSRVFTANTGRTVSISNLTLTGGNGSGGNGGAIQNNGTLSLKGVTLNNNTATNGGAIRSDGALVMTNCTISGNRANGDGGGLYNAINQATLTNVTVAYNRADNDNNGSGTGGGVFQISGNVLLHNTIVADNYKGSSPSTTADDVGGTIDSSSSYNLIGTGSGGLTNGINHNQVGVTTAFLGALINNSGVTATHGLLYNSPAIDAGDDAVLLSPLFITTDQRNATRPANGDLVAGSHVDIGAYERQATETRDVPNGRNVQIDLNDARVTFPCVPFNSCGAGKPNPGATKKSAKAIGPSIVTPAISITDLDPSTQPAPPSGFVIGNSSSPPLPAFDVATTSVTSDTPITICFYLPVFTNATYFSGLRIFHNNGSSLDLLTNQTTDFANKLVCGQVSSFSPFVIGHTATPTATNGTVGGQVVDDRGNPVEGAAVRMSGTQNRLTITDAQGNYYFDSVDTNGLYVVTPSRANFTFSPSQRSFSQLGAHTEATFTAVASGGGLNPLDTTEYFVRQQYLDFLGREPDESGFNFWVNNIESCGNDVGCREVKRIDTSAAFFLSIEFQQTGYLVYRTYQAAYADLPGTPVPIKLSDFRPDTQEISSGVVVLQDGWQQKLETNKLAFMAEFVKRSRFSQAYPTTMTPTEFVDKLFANASLALTDSDHGAAIAEFGAAADSNDNGARARVLRRIAENQTLTRQQFNQAFVLMEYFGYLRRDPNSGQDTDFSGYNFWLEKLNHFNGSFQNAEMVKAFLSAIEYRGRFPR
ncbi:MAG: hypothetical protein DMF72_08740 [Acidobacteria bacterium]|nr:MAG: hypothetical protein DMF72_08740 [Acidobacteriota bacterium]